MSSRYVQHGLHGQRQPAPIGMPEPLAVRAGWTVLALGAICLALGVAIARDADAEARDRIHQERAQAQLERLRTDRLWLDRMANAYAHGRQEAIEDLQAQHQGQRLAHGCQLIVEAQP